jgi:hypothetical protein
MLDWIEWMWALSAFASVSAPLLYALGTLHRLQHKTIYPLFRFIDHNGRFSSTDAPSS